MVGLFVVAMASGCERAESQECKAQAAELRAFLTELTDEGKPMAPPSWTTGDADFDARLEKRRAEIREAMKPIESHQIAEKLATGIKPGLLEEELAGCPQAIEQLHVIGKAAPSERRARFIGLADAIAACNCKVELARIKPLLYAMQRGPD